MLRWLLPPLLLLAGCSKGPEADLQYISSARSLAAEWALVNEQAEKGHLTGIYARAVRKQLREQIRTTAKSLTQPKSNYGTIISGLTHEPAEAPPKELRARASQLKQIEDSLESA